MDLIIITMRGVDEIRTSPSPRPFMLVCRAVGTERKVLQVIHIQDGGKKVPVAPILSR